MPVSPLCIGEADKDVNSNSESETRIISSKFITSSDVNQRNSTETSGSISKKGTNSSSLLCKGRAAGLGWGREE